MCCVARGREGGDGRGGEGSPLICTEVHWSSLGTSQTVRLPRRKL